MNKIKIILAGLVLIFAFGCEDYLDVNTDPNNLSELTSPEVTLPVAQVNLANNLMGWDMGFAGAYWSQYWTQSYTASQFKFLDEYQETSFENAFIGLYAGSLNDFKAIKNAAGEGTGSYYIAEILSIYTWQIITDVWGDMPYFEALRGQEGIFAPKTDAGEDIYADLLTRIDAILATDYSGMVVNPEYDFIFGGSMDDWYAFANTLKLKLMLRQSETPGYNNAEVLEFVEASDLLAHNALISGAIWEEKDGKQHPMVEFEAGGANFFSTNVIASKTLVDYMVAKQDPRLGSLFNSVGGIYVGAFQGDFDSKEDSDGNGTTDDKESYSTVTFESDTDIPLMTLWETYFYVAEVYARANDNVGAKMYYDAAVQSSLDYWGYSTDTLVNAGGAVEWVDGTAEEDIKQIAMQKWVSYCKLQHIEAFLERNRTKYPAVNEIDIAADRPNAYINFPVGDFTISVKGRGKLNGNLPSSPIYPNSFINRNPNSPSQKSDLGEKVWWNQKQGK